MLSNCLLTAIKNKILHPFDSRMFLIYPLSKDERGIPHFGWKYKGELFHFTYEKKISHKMRNWYKFILFRGHIERFPEEYLEYVELIKVI